MYCPLPSVSLWQVSIPTRIQFTQEHAMPQCKSCFKYILYLLGPLKTTYSICFKISSLRLNASFKVNKTVKED